MESYLVLLCSGGSRPLPAAWHDALAREGLRHCSPAPGIDTFAKPTVAVTMIPGRGLLIGTIFARSDHRTPDPRDWQVLPPDLDLPRWLIDRHWGRYVAIVQGRRQAEHEVVRDPAGMVRCYIARAGPWTAVTGDATLLRRLGLVDGRIDWATVGQYLLMPDLRSRPTCLHDVIEPVPGERVTIAADGLAHELLWTPERFVVPDRTLTFAQHVDRLRGTIDDCVAAWARGHDRVMLSLSGGLDSSILATSVPNARQRIDALNLSSGEGRGSELDYASCLAELYGFPLIHTRLDGRSVDPTLSLAANQPRPSARSFTQPIDQALAARADAVRASAHFNGGGGDSVLAFLHSANPAADRLRIEGPGRSFARTVVDLSEVTHCTPWHVARRAVTKAWFGRPAFAWPKVTRLLRADALQEAEPNLHPWFDRLAALLPGQREHGLSILRSMSTLDHLNIEDDRPTLYPLLSQPVVELCLGIPTWLNCAGGRNRAVARAAFADRFPSQVAARRTKGSFDTLLVRAVEYHRIRIREMLLDGQLAKSGLIDTDAVRAALDRPFGAATDHGRLLQFADVEAWAAGWG
jgi:asparagine synthase (glutamine-hydrolysing)